MNKKIKSIAVVLLSTLGIILPVSFYSNSVSAYTATINTDDNISLDILPTGDGTTIRSTSVNIQSDCRAGYNLTIATPNGSSLYKYSNNTQSSSTASFTSVDGTSALSSSNNTNKWGYTLTNNPTSSTIFSPLSSTASTIKTSTETASPDNDIDDIFNINYGIKAASNIEPGNYQMADDGNGNAGSIVYYLTMDTTCTQYTVQFNPNGGTVTGGGNNPTQGIESGTPTKLLSSDSLTAPTTASYTDANNNTINGNADKLWTFWGWNTQADGTGDWYKDREEVEDLASVGSTITLYAQWKQATLADMVAAPATQPTDPKQIDHNLMQDMSPETCYNSNAYSIDTSSPAHTPYDSSTNIGGYHTITLLDYRGKVITGNNPEQPEQYTISKLPDNNCWMTRDLNLGRESGGPNNDGTITLTSSDTDLLDNTTFALPASPTTYTTGTVGHYTPQILINHTVSSYTVNSIQYSPIVSHYSWAAATATNSSITVSGNITSSICPKNWDLPTSTQYSNLKTKGSITSATIAHGEPYNFVYGGYRNAANGYYSQTSYGYYWTSTNSSSNYAYWNYAYSSGLYSSTSSGYKYYGNKLRCVASNGVVTINYDGNGTTEYPVTGTVASQENVEINTASTQPGTGFTRTGWTFNGWNTAADGSGTSIAAGANISTLDIQPGGVITLYAQWVPQYTITYVNNCMSYANTNASCTQSFSDRTGTQKINLDASGDGSGNLGAYNYNSWTLTGWKIAGWNTSADGTGIEYPTSSAYNVTNQEVNSGITLYAHWAPVYSIQYDGNGASNTDGMGTTDANGVKSVKQTNIAENNPVTLLPSNYTRTGYGFAGWSTSPTATIGGNDKIYGPMETISAPSYPNNATNTVTMYAVWVAAEKDGNNNPVYLQDFNKRNCDNLTSTTFDTTTGTITPGSVIALTDKRDNKVYTIAKLADDNCWMVENFKLEHEGTIGQNINDPNVTNQSLSQGYGRTSNQGNFVGLANSESISFHNSTVSNSIYKSSSNPPVDSYDPTNNTLEDIGTSPSPGYRIPRYNNNNTANPLSSPSYTENYANPLSPSASGTYKGSTVSSYGNYYSWAAAKATTEYAADASIGTSICPSGWALPDGNLNGNRGVRHYNVLSQKYGGTGEKNDTAIMSNRFRAFPNNFLYSGYYDYSASGRGSYGYYWSRSSAGQGVRLYLDSTSLDPASANEQYRGFAVRCITNDAYTIQYDGNGADNPSGMGTTDGTGDKTVRQTGVIDGLDVLLLASNYKRTGYGFAGWSTDPNAWAHFTDNDNSNDPIIYGPMETIKAPVHPTIGDTVTLYAVWIPAKTSGNNPVYLQDFDSSQCGGLVKTDYDSTTGKISTTKNSIIALTDKRDNEVYVIARLADGNCWMIENLRLEHEGTIGNSINDSNVTNQSLAQGYGGTPGTYGSFVGLAEPESDKSNFSFQGVSNTIYKSSANPPLDTYDPLNNVLEDIGTSDNPGYRFPRYSNINTAPHDDNNPNITMQDNPKYIQDYNFSRTDPKNIGDTYTLYYRTRGVYSYGNYYTWAAAMANTNKYSDSSSETASTSICPFGWHLPTSNGANKEFGALSQKYGGTGNDQNYNDAAAAMSNRFRTFPNNFMLSGVASSNYVEELGRGTEGWYWSQTADYGSSYSLNIYTNRFSPSRTSSKTNGFSIRCLIAPNQN